MAITQVELRKKKKLAEAIVSSIGGSMDDKLGDFYQGIIDDNSETIEKALASYKKQQSGTSHYNGGR